MLECQHNDNKTQNKQQTSQKINVDNWERASTPAAVSDHQHNWLQIMYHEKQQTYQYLARHHVDTQYYRYYQLQILSPLNLHLRTRDIQVSFTQSTIWIYQNYFVSRKRAFRKVVR